MNTQGRGRGRNDNATGERIISAESIEAIAAVMEKKMSPEMRAMSKKYRVDLYSTFAFNQVAQRCVREREQRKVSPKDIAGELKVPQYKLQAIEKSSIKSIDPMALDKYLDYLGIGHWFDQWRAVHYKAIVGKPPNVIDFKPIHVSRQLSVSVYRFKVTLPMDSGPVWRRIELLDTATFWDLHCAIQDAMPWTDMHLHDFEIKDRRTGRVKRISLPVDDAGDLFTRLDWKILISDMFSMQSRTATYTYDFGDGWRHKVLLEGIFPRDKSVKYPRCLAGARACPPEDCGGVGGYQRFLEAMSVPQHPEHKNMVEWIGQETFDPDRFILQDVHFSNANRRRVQLMMEDL